MNREIIVKPSDNVVNQDTGNREQRTVGAYSLLTVLASFYAFLLNSERGREFATEHTWASVVVGTTLVLGCIRAILPRMYWRRVAWAFVFAGAPMIGRSVYHKAVQ